MGEGHGQRVNSRLSTIVGKHHWPGALRASRPAEIENLSPALALHDGPDDAGAEEGRAQIIVQLRFPRGQGQFVGVPIFRETTGQIDEHVDVPIGSHCLLDECLCPLFCSQISRNGDDARPFSTEFLRTLVDTLSIASADRKECSLASERSRERIPNLPRLADAGHNSNLIM